MLTIKIMRKKLAILALGTTLLISCSNSETNDEQVIEEAKPCLYNYDETSTSVKWTAFKFNEKTAVGGMFEKVNVLISAPSEDLFSTLTGASFTIPTESVNSSNEERDGKIKAHFFGAMSSTDVISGIVKSINETTANIEITMNGVSKDYQGSVSAEGAKVEFNTTINLNDFEANYAIDSLNAVCNDLHKGADGISKLWSEVDIKVETTLLKQCP